MARVEDGPTALSLSAGTGMLKPMSSDSTAVRVIVIAGAALAIAIVWVCPGVVFPSPGANDAPVLWTLPMPIVAVTLVASLVLVARNRARHERVISSIGLGTFLAGVAVAFVAGLIAVANLQNDRFWPFLLWPIVFGVVGTVILAIALSGASRFEVVRGVAVGAPAAIFLAVWIVVRRSRDWLLATYGFDVCVLITIEAAIVYATASWRRHPHGTGVWS